MNIPKEFALRTDYKTQSEINQNWRGYEAGRAILGLKEKGFLSILFGNGFGALIDLGLEMSLGGEMHQYIPILHNGYIYLMFKTGLLGLLFYVFGLIRLYFFYTKGSFGERSVFFKYLVSAVSLYFIFSTLAITGVYNKGDILTFFLGAFIAFYYRERGKYVLA
ncbi:hypothetical protein [Xanthovirga aplysinae]|uniref:hypothetical protein n=1 Tax=Xanthovirga aplysinae TaxID=2529853 RepID=UPI0012BCCCD5|nr:hypothetical protein [Xanthovirga aplysinae]MTI30973.1 hypothetical protein [Xanthovirga aplysinae]